MDRINCLTVTEPLRGDNLLFTTESVHAPGTYFGLNQLRKDERLSRSFFRASQWF